MGKAHRERRSYKKRETTAIQSDYRAGKISYNQVMVREVCLSEDLRFMQEVDRAAREMKHE